MAEISVIEHADSELAEFVVVGAVSATEISGISEVHSAFMRRKHFVDMTEATFFNLDSAGLLQIARAFKKAETSRRGGRTAIVVSSELNSLIPKLFAAISTDKVGRNEGFNITISRDEALLWLTDNGRKRTNPADVN